MKTCLTLFVILVTCSCSPLKPSKDNPDEAFDLDQSYDPGTYFLIPAEEIRELKRKTLNGNGAAAHKLAEHYEFGVHDHVSAFGWFRQCALLGDADCRFAIGSTLIDSKLLEERRLGYYWLKLAATVVPQYANSLQGIREQGLLEGLEYPPLISSETMCRKS